MASLRAQLAFAEPDYWPMSEFKQQQAPSNRARNTHERIIRHLEYDVDVDQQAMDGVLAVLDERARTQRKTAKEHTLTRGRGHIECLPDEVLSIIGRYVLRLHRMEKPRTLHLEPFDYRNKYLGSAHKDFQKYMSVSPDWWRIFGPLFYERVDLNELDADPTVEESWRYKCEKVGPLIRDLRAPIQWPGLLPLLKAATHLVRLELTLINVRGLPSLLPDSAEVAAIIDVLSPDLAELSFRGLEMPAGWRDEPDEFVSQDDEYVLFPKGLGRLALLTSLRYKDLPVIKADLARFAQNIADSSQLRCLRLVSCHQGPWALPPEMPDLITLPHITEQLELGETNLDGWSVKRLLVATPNLQSLKLRLIGDYPKERRLTEPLGQLPVLHTLDLDTSSAICLLRFDCPALTHLRLTGTPLLSSNAIKKWKSLVQYMIDAVHCTHLAFFYRSRGSTRLNALLSVEAALDAFQRHTLRDRDIESIAQLRVTCRELRRLLRSRGGDIIPHDTRPAEDSITEISALSGDEDYADGLRALRDGSRWNQSDEQDSDFRQKRGEGDFNSERDAHEDEDEEIEAFYGPGDWVEDEDDEDTLWIKPDPIFEEFDGLNDLPGCWQM